MEAGLSLSLKQQLKISTQLVQTMEFLALSTEEIAERIHKEADDAHQYNTTGGNIQFLRSLMEKQPHKQDDKNRCGKLENNRVGRSSQLVGQTKQCRGSRHADGPQSYPLVKHDLMARLFQIDQQNQYGDQTAHTVDGQR